MNWERAHYQPGGGEAALLYFVYGTFPERLRLSRSEHRSAGAPPGVAVHRYDREHHPDRLNALLDDKVIGGTLDESFPDLSTPVRTAHELLIVKGTVTDPDTLLYLRDVVGLIASFLDSGGIAVLDPQTLSWWRPGEWRESLFDPDAAGFPAVMWSF